MNKTTRLSQASRRRQQLIRTCQALNFGEVRHIRVQGADPMLESARLLVDERLDLPADTRREIVLSDFDLREEWHRLFARFDIIQNGIIEQLEVRGGIPRRVIFESEPLPMGE